MKTLKSFLYIIACAAVFLIILKSFGTPSSSQSASAFEWEKTVNVYFPNEKMGSSEDCEKVFALSRTIPNAETLGPGATQALLLGVSENEKSEGYFTSINSGVLIKKFEIKEGVAFVDFNPQFKKRLAGSCKVSSVRAQIEKTLIELPDIESVVVSVEGETEGIFEP